MISPRLMLFSLLLFTEVLSLSLGLSGCVTSRTHPRLDLAIAEAAMMEEHQENHQVQVTEFLRCFEAQDLERLMRMTSPIIRRNMTDQGMQRYYQKLLADLAPYYLTLQLPGEGMFLKDDDYNVGLEFKVRLTHRNTGKVRSMKIGVADDGHGTATKKNYVITGVCIH